jgi:hypothetical protein
MKSFSEFLSESNLLIHDENLYGMSQEDIRKFVSDRFEEDFKRRRSGGKRDHITAAFRKFISGEPVTRMDFYHKESSSSQYGVDLIDDLINAGFVTTFKKGRSRFHQLATPEFHDEFIKGRRGEITSKKTGII